ncbi:hypothetical protein D3C72_2045780 [compost metagenome]
MTEIASFCALRRDTVLVLPKKACRRPASIIANEAGPSATRSRRTDFGSTPACASIRFKVASIEPPNEASPTILPASSRASAIGARSAETTTKGEIWAMVPKAMTSELPCARADI